MKQSSTDKEEINYISIHGAREHNLKNIDAIIPRDKLTVITGLSGSGKSSLAFDTIYAEGQRRYVECMSAYARQFLGMMKKPEVDIIDGLSPAISIEQKSISHNPRSTVGTTTEIYDYLRLLYAKTGVQFCIDCHIPVTQKTIDQIIDEILNDFGNKKIMILAPLVKARKGHYRELFEQLQKSGYTKVRVDGEIKEIEDGMQLARYNVHDIELVVDRLLIEDSNEHRLAESLELALKKSDGKVLIIWETVNSISLFDYKPDKPIKKNIKKNTNSSTWSERLFSTAYTCPSCNKAYDELAPNKFSFNSPYGACPVCEGLGELTDFNIDLVIPDKSKTINQGAIAPIGKQREMWLWNQVEAFAKKIELDLDIPIANCAKDKIDKLIYGTDDDEKISVEFNFSSERSVSYQFKFAGILPTLKHQYSNSNSQSVRQNIENFMSVDICPECNGGRLKKSSLNVFINENSIYDITRLDINSSLRLFSTFFDNSDKRTRIIAEPIIKEIISRLQFLVEVGLSYLSLDRAVRTLSGGESQRIRLASQIGSNLVGITYVLDEPSIGLHQHDNYKLINSLKRLRDLGNTVIVVEHDKSMILESDFIIDLGPGAGVHGGNLILSRSPKELDNLSDNERQNSLTVQYLLKMKNIQIPVSRRKPNGKSIMLKGATGNNLQNIDLNIHIGLLTCITGMSGSGKSSLINDTLFPILSKYFYRSHSRPLPYQKIEGLEHIDKIIEIDQSPIGRTPRSNPVTYTGIFTQIREFMSLLPESKSRGYKSGRFSFNVAGGRCDDCEGGGIKKIEMNFLPDVYVMCDTCNGKRYNSETLQVRYKGKSIADILEMTVEESISYFEDIPKISRKLKTLNDVGLGYIHLGQQAPTLSGGEAQRVKLAAELSKTSTGKTLYLLDEPTTGLHFEDINILIELLDKLVNKGNTVVIIEHNLDVIKYADWIIDMGPEGGDNGGKIIAEGTPEEIVKIKKSYTGRYLAEELNGSKNKKKVI